MISNCHLWIDATFSLLSLECFSTIKTQANLPESVFLFLPEVKIPLDNGPNMLGLCIRQLGQVQLLACTFSRHER